MHPHPETILPSPEAHIESRIRALAVEVSMLHDDVARRAAEWAEIGEVMSDCLKEINAKVGDNMASIQKQTSLLQQVQRDLDQLREHNAPMAQNSTYARLHMHIAALRQRLAGVELQLAVAIEKIDSRDSGRTWRRLKRWWRRESP